MTKRDDQVSLVDMLFYTEEAIDMLGDASLDAMASDRKMQLALQRLVEIVGVDLNVLWDVIVNDLPLLVEQLRTIVGKDQN